TSCSSQPVLWLRRQSTRQRFCLCKASRPPSALWRRSSRCPPMICSGSSPRIAPSSPSKSITCMEALAPLSASWPPVQDSALASSPAASAIASPAVAAVLTSALFTDSQPGELPRAFNRRFPHDRILRLDHSSRAQPGGSHSPGRAGLSHGAQRIAGSHRNGSRHQWLFGPLAGDLLRARARGLTSHDPLHLAGGL